MVPYTDTIGHHLVKLCKLFFNHVNAKFSEFGLYEGQHSTLMVLWQEDGLAQAELTRRLGVEPASVSKTVERMEAAGFVQRRPDPEDARANRIYLTDQGRALEQPVRQVLAEAEDRLLTNISLEEKLLLRRLVIQMRDNLK